MVEFPSFAADQMDHVSTPSDSRALGGREIEIEKKLAGMDDLQ